MTATQLLYVPRFPSATEPLGRRSGAAHRSHPLGSHRRARRGARSRPHRSRGGLCRCTPWPAVFITTTSTAAFVMASSVAFVAAALSTSTFFAAALSAVTLSVATFCAEPCPWPPYPPWPCSQPPSPPLPPQPLLPLWLLLLSSSRQPSQPPPLLLRPRSLSRRTRYHWTHRVQSTPPSGQAVAW
jgi:hypothetical protein